MKLNGIIRSYFPVGVYKDYKVGKQVSIWYESKF